MNNQPSQQISQLNHTDRNQRLESLRVLMAEIARGTRNKPQQSGSVNNHIHTTYSFSPYSPTKAIWMAYNAGLTTAGIMDHDSISGAREFIEAGKIAGMATTIGMECRADFSQTALQGRLINNPDQKSIAYLALHGVPHTQIDKLEAFFAPYSQERNKRNCQMVDRLNTILNPHAVHLDFVADVLPLSLSEQGGSITERHLLFAVAHKLIAKFGKGKPLVDFLKETLKLTVASKIEEHLLDNQNPHYDYDILGVLKGSLVKDFYLPATTECPPVQDVVALSKEIGCILAYAYLGDVADSVTGDKKSQKFEDDYLELLFATLTELGFPAVTYMPSRNTLAQLMRVKEFCHQYGLFEISGEDINSPRQSFICDALLQPEFANLIDATWALIGHEKQATKDLETGLFGAQTQAKYPDMVQRLQIFKELGQS